VISSPVGVAALRKQELERARAVCERGIKARRGEIVFIAGSPASGRTALLAELARTLPKLKGSPRVLAGAMVEGKYVPTQPAPRPSGRVLAAVEGAIGIASVANPLLGLISQIISTSRAAARVLTPPDPPQAAATFETLFRGLRLAAQEQPTICLIDDCDDADGRWWSELLLGFAVEIAEELPLFLFLSVEGGSRPGEHRSYESDVLFAARELTARELAEWWPIPLADPEELLALTGPADADVVTRLCALSDRRAGWAAELWNEWLRSQIVERDTDLGPWRFAPGQPEASPATFGDVARERVRRAFEGNLVAANDAWFILACAALEGRYFTADAVALALGRDRDEVIDLLDDHLAADTTRPDGLVEEAGFARGTDPAGRLRDLPRYRFTSQLFRTALVRFGLSLDERKRLSVGLARSLEQTFDPSRPGTAARLAALYTSAGEAEKAESYRRIADDQMPATAVLEQARAIEADDDRDSWSAWQCRRAAAVLLEADRILGGTRTLEESLNTLRIATALARRGGSVSDEAEALMVQGGIEGSAGAFESAHAHLQAAGSLWRSIARRDGQAEVLKNLARLDWLGGERAEALDQFDDALHLLQQLDVPERELDLHLLKLDLALRANDLALAEASLREADGLTAWAGPRVEASLEELRGRLASQCNESKRAIAHYKRAERLYAEQGELRFAASARRGLAIELAANGDRRRAVQILNEAILTAQSIDTLEGEVEARHVLARIEAEAGNIAGAITGLETCARIYRELGWEPSVAETRQEINELMARSHDPDAV
jgi:tetratricopeptide (TPR) repeat protein